MKPLSLIILAIFFFGCKKNGAYNIEDDITSNVKVNVLGISATSSNTPGMATLWQADQEPKTTFIPNNNSGINLYGTHQLVSAGARNLVYFGTERINGQYRIILFTYEGKKVLSDETNLNLADDKHENFYAFSKDLNGNLFISAYAHAIGYRKIAYIYKIDNLLKIERIAMPENMSFAVLNTTNGLIALNGLHQMNHIELKVDHQNLTSKLMVLALEGYKDYEIKGTYQNHAGFVLLIVKATDKQQNRYAHFMFSLDIAKNTVKRHQLKIDEQHSILGKGLIEGNILHLPGWEQSTNKAFYIRLDTQTDLAELTVSKTYLEVNSQYPTAQALFVHKADGDIYIGGTQFKKACYWKNGRLTVLPDVDGAGVSFPTEIITYR